MASDAPAYAEWSIIELFGHRRIAGLVTADAPIMQATRLRIDIYRPGDQAPALTQFVPYPQAVYCLTPCDEAIARVIGGRSLAQQPPVARWELPAAPAAPPAGDEYDEDEVDATIHAVGCADEGCDGGCEGERPF